MKKANTNWSTATTNLFKAFKDLLDCLQAGYDAHITIVKNEHAALPIQIKNPALNDPMNWTMSYGAPAGREEIKYKKHFNDTEKDLALNWGFTFDAYVCVKGHLFNSKQAGKTVFVCPHCGSRETKQNCIPVKLKEPEKRTFYTFWKPKDNISCWVNKPMKERVFVIAYYEKNAVLKWWQKALITIVKPLSYIPDKSVLEMDAYRVITYRIGGVANGYSIDVQIPKKFGFE